jgi:hypothetical protein
LSSQTLASWSALRTAFTVLGFFSANSAVNAQHLSPDVLPDVLVLSDVKPMSSGDAPGVPRLADAVAVHLSDLHVRDHLGRRDGDERDVLVRMDAARGQVVRIHIGVGARREGHRERHGRALRLRLVDQRLERLRVVLDLPLQRLGQRDRLAVAG